MRVFCLVLLPCLVLSVVGCGGTEDRGLSKHTVSGKVTYNDKPLTLGSVVFMHSTGEIDAVNLDSEGKYSLDVALGSNQVTVQSREDEEFDADGVPSGHKGMKMPGKSRIPEKYSHFDSSKLTFEVKSDGNTYDIALTDE